jgi:hypothetical protein
MEETAASPKAASPRMLRGRVYPKAASFMLDPVEFLISQK